MIAGELMQVSSPRKKKKDQPPLGPGTPFRSPHLIASRKLELVQEHDPGESKPSNPRKCATHFMDRARLASLFFD